jgi:hypothetical protein
MKKQSQKICTIKYNISKLERTLSYQRSLQKNQQIPKKFSPQSYLETDNISLQNTFKQQFNKIFYDHLTAVINNNTISLQIKKAQLESEFRQTENILINSIEPQNKLITIYQKFLEDINLP